MVSDGCTNMIASDVLPESLADPATSALTAGRKLRWWRDLHSFRRCRLPIDNLRMAWSAQMCLALSKGLHDGFWNAAAGSDERRAHKGEKHAIRSQIIGGQRPSCLCCSGRCAVESYARCHDHDAAS